MTDAAPTVDSRRCERCGEDVILIDVPGFGRREVLSKRRSTLHLCNLSRPAEQGARSRKTEPPSKTSRKVASTRSPNPTPTTAPASTTAETAAPTTAPTATPTTVSKPGRNPAPRRGEARKAPPRRDKPSRSEHRVRKPPAVSGAVVGPPPAQTVAARDRQRSGQRPVRIPRNRGPVEKACRDCGAQLSIAWDQVANRRRALNADGTTHRCDPTLFVPKLADCPTCGAPVLLRRERGDKGTTTLKLDGKTEHACVLQPKARIARDTPVKVEDEKVRPFTPLLSDSTPRDNECPACGNLMAGPAGARICPHCS